MANEKRLIDANALVETIVNTPSEVAQFHTYNVLSSLAERQHEILNIIDEQPTVDAVEAVRCGKCLYYSETTGKDSGKPCGYGSCTKPFHITNIVANEDFCSFGQRRADAKMDGE